MDHIHTKDRHDVALRRRKSWPCQSESKRHDTVPHKHTLRNAAFAKRGSPYPIDDDRLSVLQDQRPDYTDHRWRPLPKIISLGAAHAQLEVLADIAETIEQQRARQRVWDAYRRPWTDVQSDLFVKVFNDLDLMLFGGELRHRVLFPYVRVDESGSAFHKRAAQTLTPELDKRHRERVSIYIDPALRIQAARSPTHIWCQLIHEMLHAYLYIFCHDACETSTAVLTTAALQDPDRYHGPLYFHTCQILAWRLALPELNGTEIFAYSHDILISQPLRPSTPTDVLDRFYPYLAWIRAHLDKSDEDGNWLGRQGLDLIPGRRRHSVVGRCLGVQRTDAGRGRRKMRRSVVGALAAVGVVGENGVSDAS